MGQRLDACEVQGTGGRANRPVYHVDKCLKLRNRERHHDRSARTLSVYKHIVNRYNNKVKPEHDRSKAERRSDLAGLRSGAQVGGIPGGDARAVRNSVEAQKASQKLRKTSRQPVVRPPTDTRGAVLSLRFRRNTTRHLTGNLKAHVRCCRRQCQNRRRCHRTSRDACSFVPTLTITRERA